MPFAEIAKEASFLATLRTHKGGKLSYTVRRRHKAYLGTGERMFGIVR